MEKKERERFTRSKNTKHDNIFLFTHINTIQYVSKNKWYQVLCSWKIYLFKYENPIYIYIYTQAIMGNYDNTTCR